jgi:hypothetical protein
VGRAFSVGCEFFDACDTVDVGDKSNPKNPTHFWHNCFFVSMTFREAIDPHAIRSGKNCPG